MQVGQASTQFCVGLHLLLELLGQLGGRSAPRQAKVALEFSKFGGAIALCFHRRNSLALGIADLARQIDAELRGCQVNNDGESVLVVMLGENT